jgi:hypothetical protein
MHVQIPEPGPFVLTLDRGVFPNDVAAIGDLGDQRMNPSWEPTKTRNYYADWQCRPAAG